jgi:hypothetical protein
MRRHAIDDIAQKQERIDVEMLACLAECPRLPLHRFAEHSGAALARSTPQGEEDD